VHPTTSLLAPLLESGVADVAQARRHELPTALEHTQRFFARIPPVVEDEPLSRLRVGELNANDHLARLMSRLVLPAETRQALMQAPLQPAVGQCRKFLGLAREGLSGEAPADWLTTL